MSCKYHPPSVNSHPPDTGRCFFLMVFLLPWCCIWQTLSPECSCCLPSQRLYGNFRWLPIQYPDVYRENWGPTDQSLTIRHICLFKWLYSSKATLWAQPGYRSSLLDFPCGAAEKLEPAFSSACSCQTIKLSCYPNPFSKQVLSA